MSYEVVTLDVRGSAMDCLVFKPEGNGPFPGVVVTQHIPNAHDGLEADPFTIDIGDKFVAKGYACVIPFIFHWWPAGTDLAVKREEWDDAKTVADLDAACGLLTSIDGIDTDRIAIMGHCWGGRCPGSALAITRNIRSLERFMAVASKLVWVNATRLLSISWAI